MILKSRMNYKTSSCTTYLQALVDCKHQYMDQYPPIEAETLSSEAVDSLEKIIKMRLTDSSRRG